LQGLGKLLETVTLVQKRINPELAVSGVVVCLHEAGTKLGSEVIDDVRGFFANDRDKQLPWSNARVFDTMIRRNIKLAESPSYGQSVYDYAPDSNGAKDYEALAREIMGQIASAATPPPATQAPVVAAPSCPDAPKEMKEAPAPPKVAAAPKVVTEVAPVYELPAPASATPDAAPTVKPPKAAPARVVTTVPATTESPREGKSAPVSAKLAAAPTVPKATGPETAPLAANPKPAPVTNSPKVSAAGAPVRAVAPLPEELPERKPAKPLETQPVAFSVVPAPAESAASEPAAVAAPARRKRTA
jgi:hypothetical protein